MTGIETGITNTYQNYKTNTSAKKTESTSHSAGSVSSKATDYGKTIGTPELSETAQDYYTQLKKKYANYDFILVSEDQKANAQANAAQYANSYKTVVLIDEDKIERMATDEQYRKQYEAILSGASSQLSQLKSSMESSGASVKGYGIQVNDGGTASYFAVLKKSSQAQKERIEKTAEKKKEAEKAAEKKAEKKEAEERLKEAQEEDSEETVTISAGSIEELLRKIEDYTLSARSDSVQSEQERSVGQTIDLKR